MTVPVGRTAGRGAGVNRVVSIGAGVGRNWAGKKCGRSDQANLAHINSISREVAIALSAALEPKRKIEMLSDTR